jgi:hypothetical protein
VIERTHVGEPFVYRGYLITATLAGPDLLGYIDGEEMPNFYRDLAAVRKIGSRNVDLKIKEQEEKKGEKRSSGR